MRPILFITVQDILKYFAYRHFKIKETGAPLLEQIYRSLFYILAPFVNVETNWKSR